MIAKASLIRTALLSAGIAAVLAASLLLPDGAYAQQQEQPPDPAVKQFGPRAKQQQAPKVPKPELVATHGDWSVQCQQEPTGSADGATQRACGMFQTAKGDRPGIALTLVVVKGEQDGKQITMMRVMAPIGVYLPTGVALEIDGDAVGRVPFTRCMPQLCMAVAEASPPTLDKLKKGANANFIIYESPGNGMAMKLSLKGFTAALAELDKL